jgi:AraC family transcriptional regulator
MKESTHNAYNQSINKTIDYINANLNKEIDLKKLAGVAHLSEFHFHRIFKAFIGESVGSYITRLKLEKAAGFLQYTDKNLEQIAVKTGYQTQQSLSRAFKKHFGINPSAFRNMETFFTKKSIDKKSAKIVKLNPEFRAVREKQLVYIRIISTYGAKKDYQEAWKKLWEFSVNNQIINTKNEYIGLSFDDPGITKTDKCRFYACITTTKQVAAQGRFGTITIKAGQYVVFKLKGSYLGLDKLYKSIYYDWLPTSGYQLRNATAFEKYLNSPDRVKESELLTEIYIPIKTRNHEN